MRISTLPAALTGFVLFSALSSSAQSRKEKPNIVFILGDDIGYGDLGCYGAQTIATPHIDTLAASGVRFTNAYAPASTSSPSRYALLTGEYAFRKNVGILPADAPLAIDTLRSNLPKLLKHQGYATAIVGKWHLGLGSDGQPVDFNRKITAGMRAVGFDYSYTFPATNDRVPTVFLENDRTVGLDPANPIAISYHSKVGNEPTGKENPELLLMRHYQGHDGTIVNGIGRMGWMSGGQTARWNDSLMGERLIEKAVSFIHAHRQEPFFLYYAPHNAHEPRVPNPRFAGRSRAGVYGDMIEELDHYVGLIVAALKEAGIYENTLLIVTSDNGPMIKEGYLDGALENIGTHDPFGGLRGEKYSLYEAGTAVPFVASWPAATESPFVQKQRFCYLDMLATLAAITGAQSRGCALHDSRDASDLFLSPDAAPYRDYILTQNNGGEIALRKEEWKYIPSKAELFDLRNDPAETTNLYTRPDLQPLIRELTQIAGTIRQNHP